MSQTRTETDSFGPLEVPTDKYWGAQTQRSIMNFPIGWEKQPVAIVRALGVIKKACAQANKASGKLDAKSSKWEGDTHDIRQLYRDEYRKPRDGDGGGFETDRE